ncbi:MAG: ADOP family duplicated permease [Vicinamibacterales bacterium]
MLQDLRFALRTFRRQRGFAAVVVLALGAGMGFTSTVFAFVDGVLFKPLPYERPDRVCAVFGAVRGDNPGSRLSVSPADLTDWRARSRSWIALEGYQRDAPIRLDRRGDLVSLRPADVTPGFMRMLGVRPILGRDLVDADASTIGPVPALLTYEAWQRVFGGDAGVLGTTIGSGSASASIVGVMPRGFVFPEAAARLSPDLLRSARLRPDPTRADRSLTLFGRLRDGVSVSQARDELSAIAASLKPLYRGRPNMHAGAFDSALVIPASTYLAARTHATFATVFGSVLGLLLLTCLNACALLLARGADRTRELSLRYALGARRRRLVRQLLVETMVLCGSAALVGIVIAEWGTRILAASVPASTLLLKPPQVDARLLAFVGLSVAGSTLVAGLWPALRLSRGEHLTAAFAAALTSTARSAKAQFGLLAAQMALASVLVIGGALMLASLIDIYAAPAGFAGHGVLTLTAARTSGESPARPSAFTRALSGIQSTPGVESAALTDGPLLDRAMIGSPFALPPASSRVWTTMLNVTPGYFQALGIPLLAGRIFRPATGPVTEIVVNRSVQRAYWPGENPLGKRLRSAELDGEFEVVGVVGDTRDRALDEAAIGTFYLPFDESASTLRATFIVRTPLPQAFAVEAVKRELRTADPGLLVSDVASLEERADRSIAERRFNTMLFSAFAGAGLLLAAIGAYGIASYATAGRMREMSIRRALGAPGHDVIRTAIALPLAASLTGIAAGLAAAYWASRLIQALLYDVQPTDPWVYALVAGVLMLASMAACLPAGRRATRVDPMVALKAE